MANEPPAAVGEDRNAEPGVKPPPDRCTFPLGKTPEMEQVAVGAAAAWPHARTAGATRSEPAMAGTSSAWRMRRWDMDPPEGDVRV
ncbi:hypothetical protein ADK55_22695 [Streptomyces sp. WM4235]|nr:hypothetical protein ADK55_22695 [Streptomyces sp. WM4235]